MDQISEGILDDPAWNNWPHMVLLSCAMVNSMREETHRPLAESGTAVPFLKAQKEKPTNQEWQARLRTPGTRSQEERNQWAP